MELFRDGWILFGSRSRFRIVVRVYANREEERFNWG